VGIGGDAKHFVFERLDAWMFTLDFLAVPPNWIPYVHIGLMIVIYTRSFDGVGSLDFYPSANRRLWRGTRLGDASLRCVVN